MMCISQQSSVRGLGWQEWADYLGSDKKYGFHFHALETLDGF